MVTVGLWKYLARSGVHHFASYLHTLLQWAPMRMHTHLIPTVTHRLLVPG